jgi:ankyrin repeat protein
MLYAATMNSTTGAPRVVQAFLKAAANVDAVDSNGLTPLMLASWVNGNPDVVDTLLKAGANARLKSNNGKTALDYGRQISSLGRRRRCTRRCARPLNSAGITMNGRQL